MRAFFLMFFSEGITLVLAAVLSLSACGPDKEAIISQKVSERVGAFRVKKNAECREMLLVEAEQIVDSLLLAEAKMEIGDSLARPVKPAPPPPLPPIDSSPVLPIFEPASSTRGEK